MYKSLVPSTILLFTLGPIATLFIVLNRARNDTLSTPAMDYWSIVHIVSGLLLFCLLYMWKRFPKNAILPVVTFTGIAYEIFEHFVAEYLAIAGGRELFSNIFMDMFCVFIGGVIALLIAPCKDKEVCFFK